MGEKTPYLLGIETATEVCAVALFEGPELRATIEYHQPRAHARLLMPIIRTLLQDNGLSPKDLEAIGVAKGPGSYTGLRVGVSTAKGLCMALNIPLLSLTSLESLAWQVADFAQSSGAWICPMIDARRMEVFCQVFDGSITSQGPPEAKVMEPGAFSAELAERPIIFLGDGAAKCKAILEASPGSIVLANQLSNASSLGPALWQKFQQGSFEDLLTFEPLYLKDFVATKGRNRLLEPKTRKR
ncbi:MAG: tRNA (adenosine(37)-N6)-threonylcarbamoyltransferase complex dimerization subunit type 1 TsaB [Bacteroidota bacterium]